MNRRILHFSLAFLLSSLVIPLMPAAEASELPGCDYNAALCCRYEVGGINPCHPDPCESNALRNVPPCGDLCMNGVGRYVCDPCTAPGNPCGIDPCALPGNPCGFDPCTVRVGTLVQDCNVNLPPIDPCTVRFGPLQDCSIQCYSNGGPLECLPIPVCNIHVGDIWLCYFSSPPQLPALGVPADVKGIEQPETGTDMSNCPPSGVQSTVCKQTSCFYGGAISRTFLCHGDPCYFGTTNLCVDPCDNPADSCNPDPCALPGNPCGFDPCTLRVGTLIENCNVNIPDVCNLNVGPLDDCSIQCHSNSPFECLGICNGGLGRLICYPDDPCSNTTLQRYLPGCSNARALQPASGLAATQAPELLA